ncbi:hypothetical protein LTR70_000770 [Exophiala xenobiotica]|uniref:Uncharacterized protein n=1 Tax=Lithohypha guttulata TaxID=1690604 RepID=A0ABR0KNI4_9EURO|nr:hypothetical protein LTR24_000557 [Lithohypha guttulata]KAK5329273.1 hypothetical protein LTR70_000770 [Exophiala xenobiotica]
MKFYNLIFTASTLLAAASSANAIEPTTTTLQSGFQTKTLVEPASKVLAREEAKAAETCKVDYEQCKSNNDCCSCWCVEYQLWGWRCGGYEHPPVAGCTPQPRSRTYPPALDAVEAE